MILFIFSIFLYVRDRKFILYNMIYIYIRINKAWYEWSSLRFGLLMCWGWYEFRN